MYRSGAVESNTAGTPLAARSTDISTALRNGAAERLVATAPAPQRGLLVGVVRGSFTAALNEILLVAAIVSFAAGVLSIALIRSKDFVPPTQP